MVKQENLTYNLLMAAVRITSTQNQRVKNIIRLNKRGYRDSQRLTVVEGQRECRLALAAGIAPQEIFLCPELLESEDELAGMIQSLAQQGNTGVYEVVPNVFDKMAYRSGSGGILMTIPYFTRSLEAIPLSQVPFLVIIDGAEKPGNVGAILRTADAAGVDSLILTSEMAKGTDVHNPNAIRASLGAVFTVPAATAAAADVIQWLRQMGIAIIATTPEAAVVYTAISMRQPVAIVLGSEADGLGQAWLEAADLEVNIPMHGSVDSLNLSVSTALLLYEVVRQRGT